jgi:hypothetical protein
MGERQGVKKYLGWNGNLTGGKRQILGHVQEGNKGVLP